MKDIIKIKIWLGVMLFWGILTGRTLPQWEDIANSPLWFADVLMYWLLIVFGLVIVWQSHNIIKFKPQKGG